MKSKRKFSAASRIRRSVTPATAHNVTQDTNESEEDLDESDLRVENGKGKEISHDTLDVESHEFERALSVIRPHDLPAHISLGAPIETCQTLSIEYATEATLGVKYPKFVNWYKKTINKQCRQCKDANEECLPPVTDERAQRNFACDACDKMGLPCSWEDDLKESYIREVYRLDVGEARVLMAFQCASPRNSLHVFYQQWLDEPASRHIDDEERENLRHIQQNLAPRRRSIRNPKAVVSAKSLPAAAVASTKRKQNPLRSTTQPKKRRIFEDDDEEFSRWSSFATPSTPLPNHAETPAQLSGFALHNRNRAAAVHGSPTVIPKTKKIRLHCPPQATPPPPSNSIDSTILPIQGASPPRPAHYVLTAAPSSTPAPIPLTPFAQLASPPSHNPNPITRTPLTVSQSFIGDPDFDRDFHDVQEAKAYWIPVVQGLMQGRDVMRDLLLNPDTRLREERRRAQVLYLENELLREIASNIHARFVASQQRTKQLENEKDELRQSLSIMQASLDSAQRDIAALRLESQQMKKTLEEQELLTHDLNGLVSSIASFASRHPHSSAVSPLALISKLPFSAPDSQDTPRDSRTHRPTGPQCAGHPRHYRMLQKPRMCRSTEGAVVL